MSDTFSRNREFDFVRLEGLSRATGRPAHEWDIYIVKELIDNALDADEAIWRLDTTKTPSLSISMEYIRVSDTRQQLLIRVMNRSRFPVEQIQDIFLPQQYTSSKAFLKGITRGTLGNALKTLLGIPYALHNRFADDWKPHLKPLSICCGATEYLPRYLIDSTTSDVGFKCITKPSKPVDGTLISVGLDYFVQEVGRTREELEILAQQYALCNPHTEFHWAIEMQEQQWEKMYPVNNIWTQKLRQAAPIQWYSLTEFKDLLGAIYRGHQDTQQNQSISIENLCRYFIDTSQNTSREQQHNHFVEHVIREVGQETLTSDDINGHVAKTLYSAMKLYTPPFQSVNLGFIGHDHVVNFLENNLPLAGKVYYACATDEENDVSLPFVLEAAVAYLQEGKRQLWTTINFSPTYYDPFLSRRLFAPIQPEEGVLGLRSLLDAYNILEDTSIVVFLHLVCPGIVRSEFSKTEIEHLPFKKVLGNLLHSLFQQIRQGEEEEELRLEQTIFTVLDVILAKLGVDEHVILEQLLEELRLQMSYDQAFANWLEKPASLSRLNIYLTNYQRHNPDIDRHIARPVDVFVHIPSHPKHYFSIPLTHLSQELLDKHSVNKLLYVQAPKLEPVVLRNNWLCHMDMALLQSPSDPTMLEYMLYSCMNQCSLPLLVLHNGDEMGCALIQQMRDWSKKQHIDETRVIDLQDLADGMIHPTKVMPSALDVWLLTRFSTFGIDTKYTPSLTDLRQDLRKQFEQVLQRYLSEDIEHYFALNTLSIRLETMFSYTQQMIDAHLDDVVKWHQQQDMRAESYPNVLHTTVADFFEVFIRTYSKDIRQQEQDWFRHRGNQS